MAKHYNTAPGWPQSRAEVEALSDDMLVDFMDECHVEPADAANCLACYAFKLGNERL